MFVAWDAKGTCSRLFVGSLAELDSTLVARYKRAGPVIFGKTNTPEMGLAASTATVLHGTTRNPWNPERTSGGLSGGAAAAAAVAAGIVPAVSAATVVVQSASRRRAAGLFGLKPTRVPHAARAARR